MPGAPSLQKISATFGGKAKYAACEAFGRGPGVTGMVAQHIGMPPEWTDDGAAPANERGPPE
jgi:cytochrome c551/c552